MDRIYEALKRSHEHDEVRNEEYGMNNKNMIAFTKHLYSFNRTVLLRDSEAHVNICDTYNRNRGSMTSGIFSDILSIFLTHFQNHKNTSARVLSSSHKVKGGVE